MHSGEGKGPTGDTGHRGDRFAQIDQLDGTSIGRVTVMALRHLRSAKGREKPFAVPRQVDHAFLLVTLVEDRSRQIECQILSPAPFQFQCSCYSENAIR